MRCAVPGAPAIVGAGLMSVVEERGAAAAEEPEEASEKRVAPLELFFDLVFVFALTQITYLMSENPTWEGLGQGMLVLTALWWAWGAYAWLTNYIDTEQDAERLLMLGAMAAMLVAALATPHVFGDDALIFGVAYAAVRWLQIFIFAEANEHVDTATAVRVLARTALPAPPSSTAPRRRRSGSWRWRSTSRARSYSACAASACLPGISRSASA
jgi:low temperature requirement protein LtrA